MPRGGHPRGRVSTRHTGVRRWPRTLGDCGSWLRLLTRPLPLRWAPSTAATAVRSPARRPPVRAGAQPRAGAGRGRVADPPHHPPGRAGRPGPHRRRAAAAAPGRRGLRGRRDRRARDDRARDAARRQGGRVLPQAPPHRDRPRRRGPRPRRADPLLLHQRGHQQPVLRADGQGRRPRRLAARARPRSSRRSRRWRPTCATCRCSRTPTASRRRRRRWARSSRCWPTGSAASCAGSARPSSWASSTARPAPTARTSPPCPTPTGRR